MGALALAALCKHLENMGRSGALDGADSQIEAAAVAYDDVAAALCLHIQVP